MIGGGITFQYRGRTKVIKIRQILAISLLGAALVVTGCANVTVKQLPAIPGADASSVALLVNNDDGSVVLSGQVSRAIEKTLIEDYVRDEFGYEVISNQITHR